MASLIRPRGIVVSVDYADLLAITLRANMRHLSECLVITAPHDTQTRELCKSIPAVRTYVTDEFYRDGAFFNKGRAMESGFDILGRDGQILIWDADILFPDDMPLQDLKRDFLYGAPRRMVDDPLTWDPDTPWNRYPIRNDNKRVIGYFQLFHADSPYLQQHRPWYDQTFVHAGGGDGYFEGLTPRDHQVLLPFDVLHLGPSDNNWFGRASRRIDGSVPERSAELQALIKRFHRFKGWCGYTPSGEAFREKIESPDVAPTNHECH